jgi:hypothetical protein
MAQRFLTGPGKIVPLTPCQSYPESTICMQYVDLFSKITNYLHMFRFRGAVHTQVATDNGNMPFGGEGV